VHRRDDDIQLGEQVLVLVERAVLVDVDLDPREHAEPLAELDVELRDLGELGPQALGRQPVGHGEPG
jgi:hypothetical protein